MVSDLFMVQNLLQEGNVEAALDIINELLEIEARGNEEAKQAADEAVEA